MTTGRRNNNNETTRDFLMSEDLNYSENERVLHKSNYRGMESEITSDDDNYDEEDDEDSSDDNDS